MNVEFSGLFKPNIYDLFKSDFKTRLIKATVESFNEIGTKAVEQVRKDAQSKFKVKKSFFIKSITYKILQGDTKRLPYLQIYTKIPFMDAQETGAIIKPRKAKQLLIPMINLGGKKRMGRKGFNLFLKEVFAMKDKHGNSITFTKTVGKSKFLFVNLKGITNTSLFSQFITLERKKQNAKGKKLDYIPLALILPASNLKKHLNLVGISNNVIKDAGDLISKKMNG